MKDFSQISSLPNSPAVYALQSGNGKRMYVVYVGIAGKLKSRIKQHLVSRDSSITTGQAAATLNPDRITAISWWEHETFEDKFHREAAENVAFEVLNPVLRSRGNPPEKTLALLEDQELMSEYKSILSSEPTGHVLFMGLDDALSKIDDLESRIRALEQTKGNRP